MKVKLDFTKSVEKNAEDYFMRAKKARKKLEGAKKALEISKQKLASLDEDNQRREKAQLAEKPVPAKKEWFEKFRWFVSSDGFLVIGGRDATTNDILIKKHTEDGDLVFHTELAGSPFVIIKAGKKEVPEQTIAEAAELCASFSRAWKQGHATAEVYMIKPEQVKIELGLPKGTFMIYGDRRYFNPIIKAALGMHNNKVMAGPVLAVRKNCDVAVEILQGDEKPSAAAKLIQKKIGGEIDDIIRALPSGGVKVLLKPDRVKR